MEMPSRSFSSNEYRYGFQGQEIDNEYTGTRSHANYEYRVSDARIGRFLSIDPLTPKYPHNSPYAFSENRVIDKLELEGLETKPIEPPGGNPTPPSNNIPTPTPDYIPNPNPDGPRYYYSPEYYKNLKHSPMQEKEIIVPIIFQWPGITPEDIEYQLQQEIYTPYWDKVNKNFDNYERLMQLWDKLKEQNMNEKRIIRKLRSSEYKIEHLESIKFMPYLYEEIDPPLKIKKPDGTYEYRESPKPAEGEQIVS